MNTHQFTVRLTYSVIEIKLSQDQIRWRYVQAPPISQLLLNPETCDAEIRAVISVLTYHTARLVDYPTFVMIDLGVFKQNKVGSMPDRDGWHLVWRTGCEWDNYR